MGRAPEAVVFMSNASSKPKAGLATYRRPAPPFNFPWRLSRLQSFGLAGSAAELFRMSTRGRYGHSFIGLDLHEHRLPKVESRITCGWPTPS